MSEPGPEVKGMIVVDDWVDESVLGAWHFVTPEEVVAVVRRGVESGTIKGEMRQEGPSRCKHGEVTMHVYNYGETACAGPIAEKRWVLVIPVSDGGEDRP